MTSGADSNREFELLTRWTSVCRAPRTLAYMLSTIVLPLNTRLFARDDSKTV